MIWYEVRCGWSWKRKYSSEGSLVPSSSEIPVQYFKDLDIEIPIVYEAKLRELLRNERVGKSPIDSHTSRSFRSPIVDRYFPSHEQRDDNKYSIMV
jgi:hypothetical protein